MGDRNGEFLLNIYLLVEIEFYDTFVKNENCEFDSGLE